ncbi:MAG: cupin domain-containing protein [Bacillota bacterium]|nr:cupin domain-containing protein [Bacillota bacterium]
MNIFHMPAFPLEDELTTILQEGEGIRIERIVSAGQTSSWYDQEENEYVILLQGEAEIEFKDAEAVALTAGDCLLLPAHQIHRVSYTSWEPPCLWLCVFWR